MSPRQRAQALLRSEGTRMSLPWVPREALAALDAAWRTIHASDVERFNALLDKYHALKLQGAEAPPPVVQVTPRQLQPIEPEEEELKALVADHAGDDLRKRAIMLRQLKRDRLDGVSVEEIRRQIEQGVQGDGVMA
jgi:hypothetical protein